MEALPKETEESDKLARLERISGPLNSRSWNGKAPRNGNGSPWAWEEKDRDMNELEFLGAFYALQVFSEYSGNISIHIYLDKPTSVSYINKSGGTRSRTLCNLAANITDWCEYRDIQLSAFHFSGSLNFSLDRESRTAMNKSDWKLNSHMFQRILSIWQTEVDLFASA